MIRTAVVKAIVSAAGLYACVAQSASATPYRFTPAADRPARLTTEGPQPGGRLARSGRGGFGGRGGFNTNAPDVDLLDEFDADNNDRLDADERRLARERAESLGLHLGRGGRGGRGGEASGPPAPGRPLSPASVRSYPTAPLYDTGTLRTIFLTFDNDDWERELMAFKRTDIDVPATLQLDGRSYQNVGVQFHGNSSFSGVPIGLKHSMRIAVDAVESDQNIQGYRTLLLLNAHEDPSLLRTVVSLDLARKYFPAPKANLVRVVINGESWGIYANQQQFNKDMVRDLFATEDGARWKVPGNPMAGQGGLSYLGDNVATYKRAYDIRSKDDTASWEALIELTRVLNQTPPDELIRALTPILDIDSALRFLAWDNVLASSDGYWTRASDYSLYRDPKGRFHLLPYDVNSTFATGGRGFRGGRGPSVTLDPLEASYDESKSVAARLLAVPELRTRYLRHVRDMASTWLDWRRLGPMIQRYHALIKADVETDTKKLSTTEEFLESLEALEEFANRRRAYLLEATEP